MQEGIVFLYTSPFDEIVKMASHARISAYEAGRKQSTKHNGGKIYKKIRESKVDSIGGRQIATSNSCHKM